MNFHFAHKNLTFTAVTPLNRDSNEYSLSRKRGARRRGQALLISVLLMVFASVLAATFVTVVALNLSQTARSSSVASAKQAALAGQTFVNNQLTNSEKGERWTPADAQNGINAGDAYYYTDFERARGWDQQGYVKFPDPRSTTAAANGSAIFLTKVTEITAGNRVALGLSSDYIGQLKVDVIGRASDNDATFSQLTFYKPTSVNGNFTSFARFVGNWNFAQNKALVTATDAAATGSTFQVKDGRGFQRGMTILFGDNPATAIRRVISAVNPATPAPRSALVLNEPIGVTLAQGTSVRAVGVFMGGLASDDITDPQDFDAISDNDRTETTDIPIQTFREPAAGNTTGSIFANAGMFLEGKSLFQLNTSSTNPVIRVPDRVLSSGIIARNTAFAAMQGQVTDGVATENIDAPTTLANFVRSSSGTFDPTSRQAAVKPITPARIDQPFSRWLQATRYSGDVGAEYGYGGGVYIPNKDDFEKVAQYEADATSPTGKSIKTYRRLSISELQRLWQRKSFDQVNTDTFVNTVNAPDNLVEPGNSTDLALIGANNGYPFGTDQHRLAFRRSTDGYNFPFAGSLEQRAQRGWISRQEFLARGVLVDFQGNNIVITRDDMNEDGSVNASKAWKTDTNGDAPTGVNTFRMIINATTGQRSLGAPGAEVNVGGLPTNGFNGVIYAEGNVRVRGGYTGGTDLTIVSMANIYIEGSITRGGRNIALLAKQNVVLNPTQFMPRIEGSRDRDFIAAANFTVLDANTVSIAAPVNVGDPDVITDMRVGDRVRLSNEERWHYITNINTAARTVDLSEGGLTIAATGTMQDYFAPKQGNQVQLGDNRQYFARTIRLDGAGQSSNLYALSAFNSSQTGDRVFNLQRQNIPPAVPVPAGGAATRGDAATMSIKPDTSNDGVIISQAEKILLAPDSPVGSYDLVDVDSNGTSDDAVDTIEALKNLFHLDDLPEPPHARGLRDMAIDSDPLTPPNPEYPEETDYNNNWEFNSVGSSFATMPARRMQSFTDTLGAGVTSDDLRRTTSVGIFTSQNLGGFFNNSVPAATIGSSFDRGLVPTAGTDEFLATIVPGFYNGVNRWITYPLPAASAPSTNGLDIVAMRRDLSPNGLASTLPAYSVETIKLDRVNLAAVRDNPINIRIEATIYAQNGSWFVVPVPRMYDNLGTTPTVAQVDEAKRYRRFNYRITVQANIAENFSPPALRDYDENQTPDENAPAVLPTTPGKGAQAQWLDASSYPTNPTGTTWQTINYVAPLPLPNGNKLMLPITPDITYQR